MDRYLHNENIYPCIFLPFTIPSGDPPEENPIFEIRNQESGINYLKNTTFPLEPVFFQDSLSLPAQKSDAFWTDSGRSVDDPRTS
ncbi:hypothetical protein NQU17_09520 [Clostridiaceae bacterium HFYG-1003]|nr:hypothetical protein NQU17_09520 [Clostridiaceae bacterium HFYG-1003]